MIRALAREARRWRPVRLPAPRVVAAGLVGYVLLGALGWSLLTGEPRASLALGLCLLVLSWLVREPRP